MLKHLQSRDDWNEKSLGAKGFTLIELLVVIVILGILAAVVVFAVSGITDKGQTSACETEARTVRTAQEAKFAKDGSYASSLADLTPQFLSTEPELVTLGNVSSTTFELAWDGTKCVGGADGLSSSP